MTLNLQTIAFLIGCGLIIVAILGGGVEVKEMKIPQMGPVPRTLTGFFGAMLIVGATGVASGFMALPTQDAAVQQNQQAVAAAPAGAQAASAAVQPLMSNAAAGPALPPPTDAVETVEAGADELGRLVTLSDNLGPEQVLERIDVSVNGQRVGQVSVDDAQRSQSISFRVREGDSYRLSGTETSRSDDGSIRARRIEGRGTFDAEATRYRLDIVSSDDETITAQAAPQ